MRGRQLSVAVEARMPRRSSPPTPRETAGLGNTGAAEDPARVLETLRLYARQRIDHEVFNRLRPIATVVRPSSNDFPVLSAVLREATRQLNSYLETGKPEHDVTQLVEFIATVLDHAEIPGKITGSPQFREYLSALLDWYQALHPTLHIERFWNVIIGMLQSDLGAVPDLRERLVAIVARLGCTMPLPDSLTEAVLKFGSKPYLFSDPGGFMLVLAFELRQLIERGDLGTISGRWLSNWRRFIVISRFSRRAHLKSALPVKNDIHARLAMLFRTFAILGGWVGDWRVAATLLLIKSDVSARVGAGIANSVVGWLWFRFVRAMFRLIQSSEDRAVARRLGAKPSADGRGGSPACERDGLRLISAPVIKGGRYDILVTRAQGGIGDVMTMRPGAIRLARRRGRGRLVLATNRSFFPAFSTDDPFDLVDIEASQIDTNSFRYWLNLTECPADRVESRQAPRIRTNRIDIFARAMGVRIWPWQRSQRTCPFRMAPEVELQARQLISDHAEPGATRIGIQLRAAETYKDVPEMLDVARQLAECHAVFVFDSRPIPKREGDRFIAIDNQPFAVAVAMVRELDAVIAPDSSFLHIAGANDVPCLLVAGPTNGKVRVQPYPRARFVDVRRQLACIACWRYEFVKCWLSNGYDSVCMKMLRPPLVIEALDDLLRRYPPAAARLAAAGSPASVISANGQAQQMV